MTSRLFVSLTANCSKLLWQQLQRSETAGCTVDSQRRRVSGTQLSCASVGDQLAIIGMVSRGITGRGPIDERRYLEHYAYANISDESNSLTGLTVSVLALSFQFNVVLIVTVHSYLLLSK